MNDQFLINFALTSLVLISFVLQHVSQIIFKKMDRAKPKEDNVGLGIVIAILQMMSIAIIIEVLRYAYSK